ncbi:hypothetical protein [Magnetospira sp. QH-2]|uniref:hypothetical protein n=1 Tax=Magnetospira sp. (strain QH-2) TaxID=1288970 RepID=UPI0011DCC9CB|nr:hypothetical protein [Magnetospira sp. QH-2]
MRQLMHEIQADFGAALTGILFSRELHVENETLRRCFVGLIQTYAGHLTQAATEAQRAGTLNDSLSPADVAALVTGIVQSLALRWSISERSIHLLDRGRHRDYSFAAPQQGERHVPVQACPAPIDAYPRNRLPGLCA